MKKLFILLCLFFIPYVCFAGWDIPGSAGFLKKNSDGNLQPRDSSSGIQLGDVANCPSSGNCVDGNLTVTGTLTTGEEISQTGVEYPIWEKMDSNGDVVASCTVECSVITDGAQVCQIHFYVMSDTPGTLTNELTIDVNTD